MNYGQSENVFDGILYADGACANDVGGWAFVLVECATGRELQDAGAVANTTNNRMELLAIIKGLERLKKPCRLEIVSDSQYCLLGMESWRLNWKRQEWKHKTKQDGVKRLVEVKNPDLWKQLDELLERHQVEYSWVKGHSGHPMNERCDRLATTECAKLRKSLTNKANLTRVSADASLNGKSNQSEPENVIEPENLTELKQLVDCVDVLTQRVMSKLSKNKIVKKLLNKDISELSNVIQRLQQRVNDSPVL